VLTCAYLTAEQQPNQCLKRITISTLCAVDLLLNRAMCVAARCSLMQLNAVNAAAGFEKVMQSLDGTPPLM